MKYHKLEKSDGFYWHHSHNDEYLSMLVAIFTDGGSFWKYVKEELLNLKSRGIGGNKTDVIINGDKVTVQPAMLDISDEPEGWAIEIDRKVLLDLINQWEELVKKNAREITFYHDEDNNITVEDTFDAEE